MSMNFFNILGFVLSAQSKQLFQFKNSLSVIGRVLFAFVVLVYALGFGMAFHYADRLGTSAEVILNAINVALAVITFTKSFFPSYQPVSQALVSFYPVSRMNKAVIGICLDMFAVFPAMIFLFYFIIFAIGFIALTGAQMLLSLAFFLTALLLDRSIRLLVEYAFPLRWLYVACVLVLAGLLEGRIILPMELRPATGVLVPLLFVLSAGIQLFLALESVKPLTERVSSSSAATPSIHGASTTLPFTLKAFFGAKHIRTMLLMALGLKILMLVFFVKGDKQNLVRDLGKLHINFEWIFIAPIAWFTYTLNNSFGMNWQLWQTNEQHNTQRRIILQPALVLYLRHALLLLAIDALLTLFALALGKMLAWKYLVCWLAAALSVLTLGAVVAMTQPIKVEKLTSSIFVSMRQVSSTVGMLLVFGVMLVVSVLSFIEFWYALAVPLVLIPVAAFFIQQYPSLKHRLYNGIHH
jgi:hypothetical protein